MARRFEPFSDRVLVLPDATPAKTTGLAKPKSEEEKPTEGVVVAAGPNAQREKIGIKAGALNSGHITDYIWSAGVIIGDRVQFPRYAGRDVMHMGVKHLLLRLEEIEGRLVEVDS